ALALAESADWNGVRNAARGLTTGKAPLAQPVALRLVRRAVDDKKPAEAQALIQELLAGTITPPVRAWLLILNGDAQRLQGNRDEARTQYDLARQADPGSTLAQHARFRLAQTSFEV